MRWLWRRAPEPPEDDGDTNGEVAEIKEFAERAHERATRATPHIERAAPRIARLPSEELVSRVARLFGPWPT